jgi:hypothetical protein
VQLWGHGKIMPLRKTVFGIALGFILDEPAEFFIVLL